MGGSGGEQLSVFLSLSQIQGSVAKCLTVQATRTEGISEPDKTDNLALFWRFVPDFQFGLLEEVSAC